MQNHIVLATAVAISTAALAVTALAQTLQLPPTPTQKQPIPQTPTLGQPTTNCPDGAIAAQASQTAGSFSAGKPGATGAASALGTAPAVKPNIGSTATRVVPATKPYGAAMAGAPQGTLPTQDAAADPCANVDQLKSKAPKS